MRKQFNDIPMIIWLASYPRSGNTFLRVILNSVFGLSTYSVYGDRTDIASHEATSDVVGHSVLPEDFELNAARSGDFLYLIKTHDCLPDCNDKVIYLLRDGRESSLSYAKYIQSYFNQDCTLEDVLYGNVPFGSWSQHVKCWQPGERQNTLLLRFEELVTKPLEQISKISGFIGKHTASNEVPSFEYLHDINPRFFRSGQTDSWKTEFSRENEIIFWLLNYDQMREYYPTESLPDFIQSIPSPYIIQTYFNRQSQYFRQQNLALENQLKRSRSVANQQAQRIEQLEEFRLITERLLSIKARINPFAKLQAYREWRDFFAKRLI